MRIRLFYLLLVKAYKLISMKLEIRDHLLYLDGVKVKQVPSPNRGGFITPMYSVMHYTGAATAGSAINWLVDKSSEVSAHLHLGRDGVFVQLVPFNIKAWHAGTSSWKGISGLNGYSIGVEIQNTGTQEYTQIQLDALVDLNKAFVRTYSIKEILGHSDIAPGRKIDPGKQFPMEWLRKEVYAAVGQTTVFPTGTVPSKATTADLNLRSGAGTSYGKISVLPKGTQVNVLTENNGWAQVFVCASKLTGFVSTQYLK